MNENEITDLVGGASFSQQRRDLQLGGSQELPSHFVVLLKPEVMTSAVDAESIAVALDCLQGHDVSVIRIAALPSRTFVDDGYLALHYPRLHRVASLGERSLSQPALESLERLRAAHGSIEVIGAFDALTRGAFLNVDRLDSLCRDAGIVRLGGGSYASIISFGESRMIVLNGFVPLLNQRYRTHGALVGLLECSSEYEISFLRDQVLGSLDPSEAADETLRGRLRVFASERLGLALSPGQNGVHLSVSHLEGMLQSERYFNDSSNGVYTQTSLGPTLARSGIGQSVIERLALDYNLLDGSSPHDEAEILTRAETVQAIHDWTRGGLI